MAQIILLRHGQSQWNKQRVYTGWNDVNLSSEGMKESRLIAQRLKKEGVSFGIAFTSLLARTVKTLEIILNEYDCNKVDVVRSWQLNERHWGALQKVEMAKVKSKYGAKLVDQWRNDYYAKPPKQEIADLRSDDLGLHCNDMPYIPNGESLHDLSQRVIPYLKSIIMPLVAEDENVLVISHRHVLRVIIRYLVNASVDNMKNIDVEVGEVRIFTFNELSQIVDKKEINRAI